MKKTLVESVYSAIRDAIITGQLGTNQLILEQNIADEYGISKVTARETLQRLCHEKYLKSYPRKGYLINEITPKQCYQIQQVRYQIEGFSLRLVIKNCSDQEIHSLKEILEQPQTNNDPYETVNSRFHLRLAELSGNRYIYDTLYSYIGSVCRYAITGSIAYKSFSGQSYHDEIIQALSSRDIQSALTWLRQDLQLKADDV